MRRQRAVSQSISDIIDAVESQARAQGMKAPLQELAGRVGVRPETLSRMKSRGTGDFALIEALVREVDMRLVLVHQDERLESIQRGEFLP